MGTFDTLESKFAACLVLFLPQLKPCATPNIEVAAIHLLAAGKVLKLFCVGD